MHLLQQQKIAQFTKKKKKKKKKVILYLRLDIYTNQHFNTRLWLHFISSYLCKLHFLRVGEAGTLGFGGGQGGAVTHLGHHRHQVL